MADEPNIDIVSDLADAAPDVVVPAHKSDVLPEQVKEPVAPQPKTLTDEQPKVAPDKPRSLRDQISSALKGEDQTPAEAQQDGGRARNEDGTFAPKVPADTAAEPAATAATVPVPIGLQPHEAEVFAKLPAELQTSVARTMESLNEKAARFAGYEQIEQLIAPRRQPWALNGVTEAQALNQLFALSDFASTKPAEFIEYFAQQQGIDLEDLAFGTEPVDPVVAQLRQQVETLSSNLNNMTTSQQQAAHQNTVNEIVAFAEEVGADGKPLRPYFEELGSEVMPFIQAVMQQNPTMTRQQILQEAYDRACWGTPAVRAKMQKAANATAEAERIRQQQAEAANARSAGVGVKSGVPTSGSTPPSGSGTLRDELRRAIAATS